MADPTNMDDILSEKEPETVEKTAEAEPSEADKAASVEAKKREYEGVKRQAQRKEWEAQGRDPETGQFIKKEEEKKDDDKAKVEADVKLKAEAEKAAADKAKPAEEMTAKEKAAFAKAADETRKRQALEQRLRELEAKIPKPAEDAAKTFWDDPEAALKKQKEEMQHAIALSRLNTSEAIARSKYTDFEEKLAIFSELAMTTPGLAQQMLVSPNPAEFTYRTAANHKALQEAGGLDAMREKIKKETELEVRARLEEELKAKAETLAKERAALPGSLTETPSKGVNRPVYSGPTSMDDILKG